METTEKIQSIGLFMSKLKSFVVQDASDHSDDDQLFRKLNNNKDVNKFNHHKDVKTAVNSPEQGKIKVQQKF